MAQIVETDVLVVGGGGAAARAALEANREGVRVTMIMKGRFGESGATAYKVAETAGLQAATGDDDPEDVPEGHYQDIMAAAQGMSDPRLSRILAEEAPKAIRDLEKFGVSFLRDANGRYIRFRGCFSSRALPPRGYLVKDHAHPIVVALKNQLSKTNVQILEDTMLIKILVKDGNCLGAAVLDSQGNVLGIRAGAVVLGTGGAGGLFALNLNPPDVTGDGYVAAYRAGAELANMEFMQAGMGIVFPIKTLLHPWFFAPHPRLTNNRREEFMKNYVPDGWSVESSFDVHSTHYPFTSAFPSKYINIGIKKEILEGRGTPHHGVWADFSHLSEDKFIESLVKSGLNFAEEQWQIKKAWCRNLGFDFLGQPFEVSLYGHAINGGVLINEQAESNIQGLFACGETAAGPHGADRLGGNMLITCQVFGSRAGKYAALRSKEVKTELPFDMVRKEESRLTSWQRKGRFQLPQIREALQWTMWNNLLVVRSEEGITSSIKELERMESEQLPQTGIAGPKAVGEYLELMNLIQIGKIIAYAARERRESRGSHYREDFPNKKDDLNWDKTIIIRKNGEVIGSYFKKLG
ncbi:MAG: FAD-binding protein [Thermodesulfobacteriota bacterium]